METGYRFLTVCILVKLFTVSDAVTLEYSYDDTKERGIMTCSFAFPVSKSLKSIVWGKAMNGYNDIIFTYNKLKVNESLPTSKYQNKVKISTDENNGYQQLILLDLQITDEGLYFCDVRDNSGEKIGRGSASLTLVVKQKNKFFGISDKYGSDISSPCNNSRTSAVYHKSARAVTFTCHGKTRLPVLNISWTVSGSEKRKLSGWTIITNVVHATGFSNSIMVNFTAVSVILVKCVVVVQTPDLNTTSTFEQCAHLIWATGNVAESHASRSKIIGPVVALVGLVCLIAVVCVIHKLRGAQQRSEENPDEDDLDEEEFSDEPQAGHGLQTQGSEQVPLNNRDSEQGQNSAKHDDVGDLELNTLHIKSTGHVGKYERRSRSPSLFDELDG